MTDRAHADANIVKTVHVLDPSGNPVANANVYVGYYLPSSSSFVSSVIETTSSTGWASVALPLQAATNSIAELEVEPSASNLNLGSYIDYNAIISTSDTTTIQLAPSNLKVTLVDSAGNSLGIGSSIGYPVEIDSSGNPNNYASVSMLRSGVIPLSLPQNYDPTNNSYTLTVEPPTVYGIEYGQNFPFSASGSNGNQTFTIFSATNSSQALSAIGGVYTLNTIQSTVFGRLIDSAGNPVIPTNTSRSRVTLVQENADGSIAGQGAFVGQIGPDGTWYTPTPPAAGRYGYFYSLAGSRSTPSFLGNSFWVNSSGKMSNTVNGVYTDTVTIADQLPSTGNVNLTLVTPDQAETSTGGINLLSISGQSMNYIGFFRVENGLLSLRLPDGQYRLDVSSDDTSTSSSNYYISVSGASVSIVDSSKVPATISNGAYQVHPTSSNVHFKIVSPSDTSTPVSGSWVNIYSYINGTQGDYVTGAGLDQSGMANLGLLDGSYLVEVNPPYGNGGFGIKRYLLTLTSGSATVTSMSGTPISGSSNTFTLAVGLANFQIKIVSPTDTNTGIAAGINYCPDLGGGKTTNCFGLGANSSGIAGMTLTDGSWVVRLYPPNGTLLTEKDYSVTVSGGIATSIQPVATLLGGVYVLTLGLPNLMGTVRDSSGSAITFGNNSNVDISVQQRDQYGNWQWTSGYYNSRGTWAINLSSPGLYRLVATPNGQPELGVTYSDVITVDSSLSVSVAGGTNPLALEIRLPSANVRMLVKNPIDQSLLPSGWIQINSVDSSGNESWVENANISGSNAGVVSAYLPNGSYKFYVYPPTGAQSIPGISSNIYTATVSDTSVAIPLGGNLAATDTNTNRAILYLAKSNVTGRVLDPAGNPLGSGGADGVWVSINVQQLVNGNSWQWTNKWTQTTLDGYFSVAVRDPGTYRLMFQIQGRSDVSTTYSPNFTVTSDNAATFTQDFGDLKMASPNLVLRVHKPGDTAVQPNINVDLFSNGTWIANSNTDSNGLATFNVPSAGPYSINLNVTPELAAQGISRSSYSVTATKSVDSVVATVAGATSSNGAVDVYFAAATLKGVVYQAGGVQPAQYSQVVAVDRATNQELWNYSTQSDVNGVWSMWLPQGAYNLYARAPWQSITSGDSDQIGEVDVDANGNATSLPSGKTSTSFNITLKTPAWTGVLKGPVGDTGIANATVCINLPSGSKGYGSCTNTDGLGRWALSAPAGFVAFDNYANLQAWENSSPQFVRLNLQGAADFAANSFPTSGSGITLRLHNPNTVITVMAGSAPAQNAWVSIDRNGTWLGSTNTDASGLARFYLADLTQGFNVHADPGGNNLLVGSFATANSSLSTSLVNTYSSAHGNTFATTINLPTPNIKGIIHDPVLGAVSSYTWASLYDVTDNLGMSGSSANSDGYVSLYAPAPISGSTMYTMTVYPNGNGTSIAQQKSYAISVNSSGVITALDATTGQSVDSETYNSQPVYSFSLAKPNISGTVYDKAPSSAPIANSWISPFDLGYGMWRNGSNSNTQGNFGLLLPDGHYRVDATPPWNSSNTARSAQCIFNVDTGTISTPVGGCVQSSTTLRLDLRGPNLNLTIHDSQGNVLPYANVNIYANGWWTNVQANALGVASIFVDRAAMLQANHSLTGLQNIYLTIDPPYGASNVVRLSCYSGQANSPCAALPQVNMASDYSNTNLTLTLPAPNIKFRATYPDASPLPTGTWTVLYSVDSYGNKNWLGGFNVDASGYAAYLVDTNTYTKFAVEVDAPWSALDTYATIVYDSQTTGLRANDVNGHSFSVGTPNVLVRVSSHNGLNQTVVNNWGWISVEKIDSVTDNTLAWIGGYNLNNQGGKGILLAPSATYRIRAYPGPNRAGAVTQCEVVVNSSGTPSSLAGKCGAGSWTGTTLAMTLDNGNVVGNITGSITDPVTGVQSDTGIANAIVYANWTVGGTDATAVIGTTDSNGRYGISLDPNKAWTMKAIPINDPSDKVQYASLALPSFTPTSGSSSNTKNFKLSAR